MWNEHTLADYGLNFALDVYGIDADNSLVVTVTDLESEAQADYLLPDQQWISNSGIDEDKMMDAACFIGENTGLLYAEAARAGL